MCLGNPVSLNSEYNNPYAGMNGVNQDLGVATQAASEDSAEDTLCLLAGKVLIGASYVSKGMSMIACLLPNTYLLGQTQSDGTVFEVCSLLFDIFGQALIRGVDSEEYNNAFSKYSEFVSSLSYNVLSEQNPLISPLDPIDERDSVNPGI